MAQSFLRLPIVRARTGLGRSTIYLRVSEGRFPTPVSLGGRAVGWVESEVNDWIEKQIASSRRSPQLRESSCDSGGTVWHAEAASASAKTTRRTSDHQAAPKTSGSPREPSGSGPSPAARGSYPRVRGAS